MATSTRNISNIIVTLFGNSPTHIQTAAKTSLSSSTYSNLTECRIPENGKVFKIGGQGLVTGESESAGVIKAIKDLLAGERNTMPDPLLYIAEGLRIWSCILKTLEYYQYTDEVALIKEKKFEIVAKLPDDIYMVDIGAGDMRKVDELLQLFKNHGHKVHYMGIDISYSSLDENLRKYSGNYEDSCVTMSALFGTWDEGMEYCLNDLDPIVTDKKRVFLSLGSVIFNDSWNTALEFLNKWAKVMRKGDRILAGMDGHDISDTKQAEKIKASYRGPLYDKFFQNGFDEANKALRLTGKKELEGLFKSEDWEREAGIDAGDSRHCFWFKANKNVTDKKGEVIFKKDFTFEWFDAHKRTKADVEKMCKQAEPELHVIESWALDGSEMRSYLIRLKSDVDEVEP